MPSARPSPAPTPLPSLAPSPAPSPAPTQPDHVDARGVVTNGLGFTNLEAETDSLFVESALDTELEAQRHMKLTTRRGKMAWTAAAGKAVTVGGHMDTVVQRHVAATARTGEIGWTAEAGSFTVDTTGTGAGDRAGGRVALTATADGAEGVGRVDAHARRISFAADDNVAFDTTASAAFDASTARFVVVSTGVDRGISLTSATGDVAFASCADCGGAENEHHVAFRATGEIVHAAGGKVLVTAPT